MQNFSSFLSSSSSSPSSEYLLDLLSPKESLMSLDHLYFWQDHIWGIQQDQYRDLLLSHKKDYSHIFFLGCSKSQVPNIHLKPNI